jgi:hypothetical protein
MAWCIYKHTNKVNGRVYIGQTCQTPERRWQNGDGYQLQEVFYRAIQKYGWDSFTHEVIEDGIETAESADERERYYINLYHSCIHDPLCNGYNMTYGGGGHTKWSADEEQVLIEYYANHTERRIDLSDLLELLPQYTKEQIVNKVSIMGITNNRRLPWTEEEDAIMFQFYPTLGASIIDKLSNRTIEAIHQHAAQLNLSYERTDYWSEEEIRVLKAFFPKEGIQKCIIMLPNRSAKAIQTKACELGIKMEDPNQNRKGVGHRRVRCIETGIIYDSIAEASRATGIQKSGICEACKYSAGLPSRQKTAGTLNGVRLHWEYVD